MNNFYITLQQTVIMFLMIGVGYVFSKKKILSEQGTACLAALLLNLILPASIINSFLSADQSVQLSYVAISFGVCALAVAVTTVISLLVFKKDPVANFAAAFSNAGFMGVPLITGILGARAVIYAAPFIAIVNVLQWTYGVYLFTGNSDGLKVKQLVKNPILISLVVGIVVTLLPFGFPRVITQTVSGFAGMTAPVAMLILGSYLSKMDFKSVVLDKRLYMISLFRLVIIPLATMLVMKPFHIEDPAMCLAIFIAAAAPVGSNVAVYAQRCGHDYKYASSSVCVSTILSIVTMPLLVLLYGLF